MTLGRKLFLLVGGLVCLLLAGQWLIFRALSRALSEDVRTVAVRVGEEIVSGFEYRFERSAEPQEGASDGAASASDIKQRRVIVLATDDDAAPGTRVVVNGTAPEGEIAGPPGAQKRFVMRKELFQRGAELAAPGWATAPGSALLPGESRPFMIGVDERKDRFFLRGPALERAIPIPGAEVAATLERFGSRLLLGNLALLAVGLAVAAFLAHRLTRPLAELASAAERVGAGELGVAVPLVRAERPDPVGRSPSDEVQRAVISFNRMSSRLAELDRENRRLAEVEQLSELGEVARGLAHSLRNPLNALGLAVERLGARSPESASAAELVGGSRRQIRRIDGALRSFLALASAGSAQAEPVDVAALAREVALEALQDSSALAMPARVEVDCALEARHVVFGVAAELKAILQALVINACEAAARATDVGRQDHGAPAQRVDLGIGAGAAQVTIRLKPGGTRGPGSVTLEIEDNGPGLSESVRERLFEPHVTTKPHGSGMGLFIAQRLATARYGGTLRLETRAEGGTRATVELADRQGAPA